MNRQTIPLKSRVRYEGRVRTFDRRATRGADLEQLPDPLWHTVGQLLRSKFRKPIPGNKPAKPSA
ncbi:MAG TPA: hypothetical protein VGZ93_07540 [Candidatus Methylacidiphilales bacterium]|jgi:hypothetical protein|nr:hypothetical protein [Candidatus Methylacidiphilales bacterium]